MGENVNTYIFTYGTLKRNFPNHHFLANLENKLYDGALAKSQFVTSAKTKDLFPLIVATICGIPFILDEPGIGKNIIGEIYKVNEPMLLWLDELESHPTAYKRRQIEIRADDGTILKCWTYLFPNFKEYLLKDEFLDVYVKSMYVPKSERPANLNPYKAIQKQ